MKPGNEQAPIRVAVGTADGPRSATWRIWTGPDGSLYIGERQTAGRLKASLHRSGKWRIAFTSLEEAQRIAVAQPPEDRAVDKFAPALEGVVPGVRRAFSIVIPWLSVALPRHGKTEPGVVCWLPLVPDRYVAVVTVLLTAQDLGFDWLSADVAGVQRVGHLTLPDGVLVSVVGWTRPALPREIEEWTRLRAQFAQTDRMKQAAAPDADIRAVLAGELPEDKSRWFVDLLISDSNATPSSWLPSDGSDKRR